MSTVGSHTKDARCIDINGCQLEIQHTPGLYTTGQHTTGSGKAYDKNTSVIVLLHEGLGCVEMWRQFPHRLSELTRCPVVAYSRAGYGSSDSVALPRPNDYMTREATMVLPLVLDAIGARKYILVGHSDGATIAAINAGSTADYRVRGLILIAPHFFTESKAVSAIRKTKAEYQTGDLREKLARYHKHVDTAFNGWCDAWLDPGFVEWNVAECIDYLRVPVLAIQGAADEYGTLAQISEISSRINAPFDQTIVADCGHSPHLEAPHITLSSIAAFVCRLISIEQSPGLLKAATKPQLDQ